MISNDFLQNLPVDTQLDPTYNSVSGVPRKFRFKFFSDADNLTDSSDHYNKLVGITNSVVTGIVGVEKIEPISHMW